VVINPYSRNGPSCNRPRRIGNWHLTPATPLSRREAPSCPGSQCPRSGTCTVAASRFVQFPANVAEPRRTPTASSTMPARGEPGAPVDKLLGEFREPLAPRLIDPAGSIPPSLVAVDASDIGSRTCSSNANQRLGRNISRTRPCRSTSGSGISPRTASIDTHRRHRLAPAPQRRDFASKAHSPGPALGRLNRASRSSPSLHRHRTHAGPSEAIPARNCSGSWPTRSISLCERRTGRSWLMRHHEALSNQEVGLKALDPDGKARSVDAIF